MWPLETYGKTEQKAMMKIMLVEGAVVAEAEGAGIAALSLLETAASLSLDFLAVMETLVSLASSLLRKTVMTNRRSHNQNQNRCDHGREGAVFLAAAPAAARMAPAAAEVALFDNWRRLRPTPSSTPGEHCKQRESLVFCSLAYMTNSTPVLSSA